MSQFLPGPTAKVVDHALRVETRRSPETLQQFVPFLPLKGVALRLDKFLWSHRGPVRLNPSLSIAQAIQVRRQSPQSLLLAIVDFSPQIVQFFILSVLNVGSFGIPGLG